MTERPEVIVGDLPQTVEVAVRALGSTEVCQRAGSLVHVTREAETNEAGIIRPAGTPRIRSLPLGVLKLKLHEAVVWKKWRQTKNGSELVDCGVPPDVLRAIHELGEWSHIKPLVGIADHPVLRPDGTVLSERGYDPRTALICEPSVIVDVPSNPTHEEALRARDLLVDLVSDFPFAAPEHASAWVATLLTVLARPAISGPVPATIVDAAEKGTGKSLLLELAGEIALGRRPTMRATPKDPAEWNKALLAIAMAGDSLVVFDNVKSMIGSDALEAAITSDQFGGRLLGTLDDVSYPWRATVGFTVNNATLTSDMVRRSLHVRLESRVERPEERADFKHPNIRAYARSQRGSLLSAALTILRAYFVAGRPALNLRPMGSFEAWSDLVRSALVWAGCPDPVATQTTLRESADVDRSALEVLLIAWRRRYQDRAVLAAHIIRDAGPASEMHHAIVGLCDDKGNLPSAKSLGKALARNRGCIVAGLRLQQAGNSRDGATWKVDVVSDGCGFAPLATLNPVPRERSDSSSECGSEVEETRETHQTRSLFGGAE